MTISVLHCMVGEAKAAAYLPSTRLRTLVRYDPMDPCHFATRLVESRQERMHFGYLLTPNAGLRMNRSA